MEAADRPLEYQAARRQPQAAVAVLYAIEAMASVGGTLMSVGIFFYMKDRFGWRMPQNFKLAAAQGLVYVPGALSAKWLARRLGRRGALAAVYVVIAVLSLAAWRLAAAGAPSAAGVTAELLAYTAVIGVSWPILESVGAGGDPRTIAHRVAMYNIVWPAAGAIAIGFEGVIIHYWTWGLFLVPAAMHVGSLVLLPFAGPLEADTGEAERALRPEPELLRKRRLALWLSRTALPATYTVVYGLMPMMPSLPALRDMPTTLQTAVADVWLLTRWLAFVALARGTWWHTRPRVLLWAAVAMLVAYFGMTLPPTHGAWPAADLVSLIAWQALLGVALGMIYSGSLYFGMVLSEGSTEHGGYHEALIGLGWVLGPAAGAAAQLVRPDDVRVGVAAVGAVIAASVITVLITAIAMSRPNGAGRHA